MGLAFGRPTMNADKTTGQEACRTRGCSEMGLGSFGDLTIRSIIGVRRVRSSTSAPGWRAVWIPNMRISMDQARRWRQRAAAQGVSDSIFRGTELPDRLACDD